MSNLDKYQLSAVECKSKNTLIVAPPGSGKTTVILNRIKYLIEDKKVKSSNIIVITFTKSAAENMKNRFLTICPKINPPFFGTFHGLFYKILLRNNEDIKIIDSGEVYNLIKKELNNFTEDVSDEKVKEIINNISLKKSALNHNKEFKSSISNDIFYKCFNAYENYKLLKGLSDFDDLQIKCRDLFLNNYRLLNNYRNLFKYILVDEFQDCDSIQIEILKMLNTNIFCVGDEDQCIYSFRGSTPKCMVDFKNEFYEGKKIYLKYNYRSLKNIVDFSKEIIKENTERHKKDIEAFKELNGNINFYIPFNESEQVNKIITEIKKFKLKGYKYSDNAILYRTNVESRSLIDGFIRNKIPFKLLDKEYNFFNHFICKDIIAYLKLAINPYDKKSFARIINKPFRYVSKSALHKINIHKEKCNVFDILINSDEIHPFQMKKLEDLKSDINMLNKVSLNSAIDFILSDLEYSHNIREYCDRFKQNQEELLDIIEEFKNAAQEYKSIITFLVHIEDIEENLKELKNNLNVDGVIFSTIHGVKGMEFKNVYIIDLVDEIIPHVNSKDNIEEERRLFYVGITRAINNLYLYSPKNLKGKFKKVTEFIPEFTEKFFINSAKEQKNSMKKGDLIEHNYFGYGTIKEIDDGNIDVDFGNNMIRKFCLSTLIENNLIKLI
ncbi:ATP-dependent helicase [Clostridium tarantellae]|uniref:DNA 3'-5' helicase n=1 Tax=Clostridium tarantellae TaxID=39493 RepID=A0A6I1MM76_9CLOT|nr:ATP-dependent helicase [Clostridium tarantellae]MPQ44606.1 AAA family ATPase [Clostridium tarantellae]